MKKLINNKIWLITLPIAALSIGLPIIASSCSAITSFDSNSTTDNTSSNLQGDETNSDTFNLNVENNTLYSSIRDVLTMAYPNENNKAIDAMFKKYVDVKEGDVKDIIKMWSFNKWFDSKNKNGLSKSISSKIEILNIKQESKKWLIEFDYHFELVDSNNTKIFGQKRYTLNSELSSNVVFNTKAIKFEVNGNNQLTTPNKQLYSFKNFDVLEKVKEFLNENNSTFEVNKIIKEFLAKKNIHANLGTWKENKHNGIYLSDDKMHLTIDLNELNGEWNGLKKGLTKEEVKNIIFNKSVGNRHPSIKEVFKNLINDDKKILGSFQSRVPEDVLENNSYLNWDIILVRNDDRFTPIISHITVKNYIN